MLDTQNEYMAAKYKWTASVEENTKTFVFTPVRGFT